KTRGPAYDAPTPPHLPSRPKPHPSPLPRAPLDLRLQPRSRLALLHPVTQTGLRASHPLPRRPAPLERLRPQHPRRNLSPPLRRPHRQRRRQFRPRLRPTLLPDLLPPRPGNSLRLPDRHPRAPQHPSPPGPASLLALRPHHSHRSHRLRTHPRPTLLPAGQMGRLRRRTHRRPQRLLPYRRRRRPPLPRRLRPPSLLRSRRGLHSPARPSSPPHALRQRTQTRPPRPPHSPSRLANPSRPLLPALAH